MSTRIITNTYSNEYFFSSSLINANNGYSYEGNIHNNQDFEWRPFDFSLYSEDPLAVESPLTASSQELNESPCSPSSGESSCETFSPLNENQNILNRKEAKVSNEESYNRFKTLFWTPEREKLLLAYAKQYRCDWKKIAKKLDNKRITASSAKRKYREINHPENKERVKFTPDEDYLLEKYFKVYGTEWDLISQHIKGRSPLTLKNRYYSFIRKKNIEMKINSPINSDSESASNDFNESSTTKPEMGVNSVKNFTGLQEENCQKKTVVTQDAQTQTEETYSSFEIEPNMVKKELAFLEESLRKAYSELNMLRNYFGNQGK